jgi:hypothetical protein
MQVRNWATIRRSISLCALSLLGVIASISSMNRRQGAAFFEEKVRLGISSVFPTAAHLRFTKGIPESLLRFTRHSRDDGGRRNADERDIEFLTRYVCTCKPSWVKEATYPGNGISEHGLPTTGGAMEEDTARGLNASVQINLWVTQRHRNEF